jgi:alkylated DNA repair dioxygenase AlkB
MSAFKLARPDELPEGFLYRDGFLSADEESDLLAICRGLEFAAYDYHGYQAKRRIVRFGVSYDINTRQERSDTMPIPGFLLGVRERAAEFAQVGADDLVQAMVSEYSVGTPIGWHRDAPQFGTIVGISLASACRMRLKPYPVTGSLASHRLTGEGARLHTSTDEGACSHTGKAEGGRSRTRIISLRLEPRSIYVMRGAARSEWQHSIPAVEQLRYSITFRTLRSRTRRQAA